MSCVSGSTFEVGNETSFRRALDCANQGVGKVTIQMSRSVYLHGNAEGNPSFVPYALWLKPGATLEVQKGQSVSPCVLESVSGGGVFYVGKGGYELSSQPRAELTIDGKLWSLQTQGTRARGTCQCSGELNY